ncbi:MAG: PqqD family protein [Synergistaceae bacterium]|nr:PqqD family protein [Synergistaceae bacterium]
MKLSKDFITHNTGNDLIIVPSGKAKFSGVIKGNSTLAFIVELLKNDTTEAEIVNAIREKFDAPAEVIERDVKHALDELRKTGALEE